MRRGVNLTTAEVAQLLAEEEGAAAAAAAASAPPSSEELLVPLLSRDAREEDDEIGTGSSAEVVASRSRRSPLVCGISRTEKQCLESSSDVMA